VIRAAEQSDAPVLSSLAAQLGYPASEQEIRVRLAGLAEFSKAVAFVAVDDGQVTGLVTGHMIRSIHVNDPVAFLTTLIVDERHRGKGIGTRLVLAIERWAAENGCARITVTSGLQRVATHRFYENRAYERTGVRFGKFLP
jgi:GNAT superfamily N-acetyltransferase